MWTLNWQSVSSWKFGRLWSRQEKMKLEYKQTLKKTIILWYMLGLLVPKNLRSWNVFNLVYFTIYPYGSCFIAWVSLCHHFFHLYYYYICAFHAWYAIIYQWNKVLYLLLHVWDIEAGNVQYTLWILGQWLMLFNTIVKNV